MISSSMEENCLQLGVVGTDDNNQQRFKVINKNNAVIRD